jgi:male germ cell-associated kinase
MTFCSPCKTTSQILVTLGNQQNKENRLSDNNFQFSHSLGKGSFGEVYSASVLPNIANVSYLSERQLKYLKPNEVFAIKKLEYNDDKDSYSNDMKEVSILCKMKSIPFIVNSYGAFLSKDKKICIIMEQCDTNLRDYMIEKKDFHSSSNIFHRMQLCQELFHALNYLHTNSIQHLDLKSQNLLIKNGHLKIADFGLSDVYWENNSDIPTEYYVVTRWYRSPELLVGHRTKSIHAIDIWAAAIILMEIQCKFNKEQPFLLWMGKNSKDQFEQIYSTLGSFTVEEQSLYETFSFIKCGETQIPSILYKKQLKEYLYHYVADLTSINDFYNLIEHCFNYIPSKRWNAWECLHANYFISFS